MEIQYPSTLLTSLKGTYLLLDTNVFRDAASRTTPYTKFFNDLKKVDVTLATSDLVKYELLMGSANAKKYQEKEDFINSIVDAILPTAPPTFAAGYELAKEYGIEGTGVKSTDLLLGALLKQYKHGIYVMTRDTTDFIQNVFDLNFIVNCPFKKGIHTYGIYSYHEK